MRSLVRWSIAMLVAVPALSVGGRNAPAAATPSPRADVTIPFELVNRNIFIQVSPGGAKPLWFVLDTGDKYAVVDLAIAKSLGLEMADSVPVGGAGKEIIMGHLLKNSPYTIPGLDGFSQPLFIALPLGDLARGSGHEFSGILGFDFLSQFVVSIDYVKSTITLREKTGWEYHGDGEILPITFNAAAHPLVAAQIVDGPAPLDGTFVLDLGSNGALILNKPFVDRERFLESGRPTLPWLEGRGLGGGIAGTVGRMKGLRLGRFLIDNPVVVFSQATSGPFASSEDQGNIGGAILEKFTVTLDYERKRIILEPNAKFPEPLEYSRTGLSLVASGDDFRTFQVFAVADSSPASEAGLEPGDVLSAIDGRPASAWTLSQLRLMFKDAPACALTIRRGEEIRQVTLRLRRMI